MPIYRDCNNLLLEIEKAVRNFPRYHKYTVGSDLRRQGMSVCRLLVRALEARLWQRQVRDPATAEPWRITGLGADGALQLQQGTRTMSWTRWADARDQGL